MDKTLRYHSRQTAITLRGMLWDAHPVKASRQGDNLNSLIEGWGKQEEFATWSGDLPASDAINCGRYKQWCFILADDR